jgi:hypothetical protein
MPFSGSVPTDFQLNRRDSLVDLYVRQNGITVTTITMDAPTTVRLGNRLVDMGERVLNGQEEPAVEDAWAL